MLTLPGKSGGWLSEDVATSISISLTRCRPMACGTDIQNPEILALAKLQDG
jgi:hypothetical protein